MYEQAESLVLLWSHWKQIPYQFQHKKRSEVCFKVNKVYCAELLLPNNKCEPGQCADADTGQFKKRLRV